MGRGADYKKRDENRRIDLSNTLCVFVFSISKNKKYSEKSWGGGKRLTYEKERKH